jgi:succinoglycan biosynthesis protein ExoA
MSSLQEAELAVVIPVLNESAYIAACLHSLLPQAREAGAVLMVMDGGSTDGTQSIVARLAQDHPELSLLNNPKRIQSAAVNLAAQIAPPSVRLLLRADAHSLYPPNFIATCVAALHANHATSVVVPMHTVGRGGLQNAIATVQASRLGNGGSAHRVGGRSGFVDHGHHALFDREFFLKLGGYDEGFSHNEDAELDRRAIAAGGRVWMCAEAAITYFPRRSLGALARQYCNFGSGRMRMLRRHHLRPKPRQMAAPTILILCVLSLLLLPLSPWFGLFLALYAGSCVLWAVISAVRSRDPWLLGVAPAAMVVHLAWGFGFLREALRWPGRSTSQADWPKAPRGADAVRS